MFQEDSRYSFQVDYVETYPEVFLHVTLVSLLPPLSSHSPNHDDIEHMNQAVSLRLVGAE